MTQEAARRATTVAVVEDHRLFSSALAVALQREGMEVLEPPLTSLDGVRDTLLEGRPHVLLLDLDLGSLGNGEELVVPMARGGTAVVVVTATQDEVAIGRCLDRGAVAWVPKRAPLETLMSAVQAVAAGETVLAEDERQRLVEAWRRSEAERRAVHQPFERLTPREAFVLGELMQGCSVEQIADREVVAEGTVRSHVRGILMKLGVRSQLQAVALASAAGWSPPPVGSRRDGVSPSTR